MFATFVIVVYESLSCAKCEKMDLNIIAAVEKGSNKSKTFAVSGGFL